MAEGEALQDYASLFLYLLKIDKNFLRGTVEGAGGGGEGGRLRNMVGMERKGFESRLKIYRGGEGEGGF